MPIQPCRGVSLKGPQISAKVTLLNLNRKTQLPLPSRVGIDIGSPSPCPASTPRFLIFILFLQFPFFIQLHVMLIFP